MQVIMGEKLGPAATNAAKNAVIGRMVGMARLLFGDKSSSLKICISPVDGETEIIAVARTRVAA
jgi:hypothetical protein